MGQHVYAVAKKRRLDVIPETTEQLEATIRKVLATPPNVIARTKLALGLK